MMQWGTRLATILFVLFTTATGARAEIVTGGGDVPPVSERPMGKDAVRRGVQGPEGLFTARVPLLINASKDAFGEPISLAPDLFYAVSDTVQLGLLHTGPMGWQSRPGVGLCLTGTSHGCRKVYDNVGFDFMYGLVFGDFHLSLHSSLYVVPISSPTGVMWTIGLTGKLHFSEFVALYFDPQVGVMLSHRSNYDDQFFLPAELQFQMTPVVSFKILSGITGALSSFSDTFQVPLGVGLVGNVNRNIDIGARFSFDNLLGHQPEGASRADARSLALLFIFRS